MWSVSLGALGGVSQSVVNQVLSIAQAAANYWGWYVDDSLANIEIEINFAPLPLTYSESATTLHYRDSKNGFDYYETAPSIELNTGVDPNGVSPDIVLTIDTLALNAGEFDLGLPTGGYISTPAADKFDLFTIILHEFAHGLGMVTLLDQSAIDRTSFDEFVTTIGGNLYFIVPGTGTVALDDTITHTTGGLLGSNLFAGQQFFIPKEVIDILDTTGVPLVKATAGNDVLHGFSSIDVIYSGAGADVIDGLSGDDDLFGEDGDDTLIGAAGDDEFAGGAGADLINGGSGFDKAAYSASPAGVSINLATGLTNGGDSQGDVLVSIESIGGSPFDDTLIGDDGNNMLVGRAGVDFLHGGAGNDTLYGFGNSASLDTLIGGAGVDLFNGDGFNLISYATSPGGVVINLETGVSRFNDAEGDHIAYALRYIEGSDFADMLVADNRATRFLGLDGDDTLHGGSDLDTLEGGLGDDILRGGLRADRLIGDAGDDTLRGDEGSDRLFAGLGNDRADGGDGFDYVVTSNGRDTLIGGDGNDTLGAGSGNDLLNGGLGADLLLASNGADRLLGGDGDDTMLGGGGRDTLTGGAGNDRLVGGSENDGFNFNPGSGADLIVDFEEGAGGGDVIRLIGFGAAFDDFADVLAAATQAGANVVIDLGGGDVITLQSVTLANLDAGDFAFG